MKLNLSKQERSRFINNLEVFSFLIQKISVVYLIFLIKLEMKK